MRLEVLTPTSCVVDRQVDSVTLHRQEERFEVGSEIVVLPRHGPLLVRVPVCNVRYRSGGVEAQLDVQGGFAEVYRDHVCILLR